MLLPIELRTLLLDNASIFPFLLVFPTRGALRLHLLSALVLPPSLLVAVAFTPHSEPRRHAACEAEHGHPENFPTNLHSPLPRKNKARRKVAGKPNSPMHTSLALSTLRHPTIASGIICHLPCVAPRPQSLPVLPPCQRNAHGL